MRSQNSFVTALAGAVVSAVICAGPAAADPNAVNPIPVLNGTNGLPALHGRTQAVYQVTGMASPNSTQNYNVLGTDLGIMWDNGRGEMMTAYGDTCGLGVPNLLAGSLWSWRSSILMRTSSHNPAHGIYYDTVVRDVFGQAKDLIPSPKIPFIEISRIPTAGISVDGVQYLATMSVKNWGDPGSWATNFSEIAVSGDNGENWAPAPETRRPTFGGHQNFQMNAFLKAGGFVYEYGTASGRGNPGYVARVKEHDIRNLGAYEYWNGKQWKRGDVAGARPIVGGVGELSVMWNDYLHRYVMLTTDPFNSVVMRSAEHPEGPWSPPQVLIDSRDLPTAYAPSLYPYQTGRELYFLTTVHSQYNVLLMHTTL